MSDEDSVYAGFWRRLGAQVLDGALFIALFAPLLYMIYGADYFLWARSEAGLFRVYGVLDLLLTRLLPVAVIVILWVRLGATPGKLLLDCRVVDARTLGPVSTRQALLRLAAYLVSALPLYLGFLWVGWDRRKQGFHDKIAKTVVLYDTSGYERLPLRELMRGVR